jgi:RecA-family ATPase
LAQGNRWLNGISPEDMEAMILTAGQSAAPVEAVTDPGATDKPVTVENPQPKLDFNRQIQEVLKRSQSGKGRVNIKTLADLQHQKFPDLKELVPGLIVEGCLLLAARPKIGKSWLTLDIGLAVAMGDKCFNDQKQCVQGDVLYLALEDGDRRIQRRGSKLLPTFTGTWPSNFYYATEWPRGNDGLAEIEKWVSEHQAARLVVIDILAKFRVPTSSKRAAYDQDYEALSGLQHLAQKYQIAIIVVHHTRKAEGADPFEEISGTLGITGAVDAAMVIKPTAQGKLLVTRGRPCGHPCARLF